MARYAGVLLSVCLVSVGCSRAPRQEAASKPVPKSSADATASTDSIVGPPIRYANLEIFPISSPQPRSEDRYTTLDEGLRAGTIEVFEIGANSIVHDDDSANAERAVSVDDLFGDAPANDDPFSDSVPSDDLFGTPSTSNGSPIDASAGPEVNRVMVVNRSNKPLYLMPGEIIMGGDQDRCVAEEFVLQPSEQPMAIDVFCVEHGRWGARAQAATEQFVGAAMAISDSVSLAADVDSQEIAEAASRGKFVASVGSLNKSARLAVPDSKDQTTVWNSVADVNADSGIFLDLGAFTGNYVDGAALSRLQPYHDALQDKVLAVENVVGVVVAVNGKIHTMDLFESTPLFTKLWPKLLKSYALDAANLADEENAQELCSHEAARTFVRQSMQADVDESEVIRGVAMTRRSSDDLISFSAEDNGMASGGFGGGDFGGVHTSAYSK